MPVESEQAGRRRAGNGLRRPADFPLEKLQVSLNFCGRGRADSSARIIPDDPQPGYGKTYNYLLLLLESDALAGAPLDVEESEAEGVALLPLEEPVVSDVELDGEELEPVLEDAESPWVELPEEEEVSLLPSVFVASSRRHWSFSAPLIESQRGELPYALGEDLSVEEELELWANAATGKASATAMTAAFTFMLFSLS